MYYYSAKNNSFYPAEWKKIYTDVGSFPSDAIIIHESIFVEFASNIPPVGKQRVAGENGLPKWTNIPLQTKVELQQQAKSKKQWLMIESTNQIAPLQDAVDLNIATEAEEAALLAWKEYRVMLNRVEPSLAPDIEWPEQPKRDIAAECP